MNQPYYRQAKYLAYPTDTTQARYTWLAYGLSLFLTLACLMSAQAQTPIPNFGIALSGIGTNFNLADEGKSTVTDAAGNVYVTGSFSGQADFDLGAGTAYLVSAGNTDIFVAKYNSAGAYQWAFNIGGTSADVGYDIAIDASNNVYLIGFFAGTSIDFDPSATTNALSSVGGLDIFVAKYNSAGAYQWAFNIGGTSDDYGLGIVVDASSNVFVTGSFQNTSVDFDPSAATNALNSAGGTDIFVAKYSSAGAYQWAFNIGGTSDDQGNSIAVDASSNVYITGQFQSTSADFDPSAATNVLNSADLNDAFVAKYSSAGAYQWAFKIGGISNQVGYGITVDASSNVYVTGYFQNPSIDFDPSAATNALSSAGSADIFVAKYSSAGAYQWAFKMGGGLADVGWGIAVDASSNVFVTGNFQNTSIDFDPSAATNALSSVGNTDIFVAKYNSSNAYQWAGSIGGSVTTIGGSDEIRATATDAAGNVYVTGYFNGTLDFDPSAAVANLASAGSDDIFVAKYNSTGAYQWAFNIGGTSADVGYGIAVDASSNVYLTGQFQGTTIDFDPSAATNALSSAGLQDIFVAKYNSAGAYQWAFKIGVTLGDVGNSIAVDASSNVYLTGYFQGTSVDFDPSAATNVLSSAGLNDAFVAKYNSAGAYQWAFNIGGTLGDVGNSIAVDASSNVYVTGYFEGASIDFDPSAATNALSSAGNVDVFVAKYNSAGAYQWAFKIGGAAFDSGNNIAVDASSNVYVTGNFQLTNIDFDPSVATNLLSSAGGNDIFIAKYSSAGAYQWAFNIGGSLADYGLGIVVDASSNVYLTGYFNGTSIDFDPSATTNTLSSAGSNNDIFVAKYNSTGAYQWAFNIGGTSADVGYGIAVDASNNLYLGGSFTASSINVHPTGTLNVLANDGTTLQGLLVRYGAAVVPTISSTGTLSALSTTYGTASANTSFSVSGTNMTAGILVTPPAGFEVSLSAGTGFGATVTVGSAGTIASTPVYIRLSATATPNTYSGNIVLSSAGATDVNVATIASTVSAKALTITGLTANNKVYDGNTTATLAGTATLVGIVGADNVTLSGTASATFASSAVGTNIAVSVTGYTLSGTAASNYTVSQPTGLTANITEGTVRGNMMSFDGVNSYVSTTNTSLTNGLSQMTVETWVKINSWTDYGGIFDKSTGSNRWFMIQGGAGVGGANDILIGVENGSTIYAYTNSDVVPTATWTHCVLVFDGTQTGNADRLKLYLNGVLQTLTFTAGTVPATTSSNAVPIVFGVHASTYSNMFLDEARIWNTARTQAQIRENMHLTLSGSETDLLAYYQFNETSGNAIDAISGNNGTLQNGTTRIESTVSVAKGISTRLTAPSGASTQTFGNATVSFTAMSAPAVNDEFVTYQLYDRPLNNVSATSTASNYWLVRQFGTQTFSYNQMSFTLPTSNVISTTDEGTPSNLKLFKRTTNSASVWGTEIGSGTSANNTTKVIAYNISPAQTSFSEFVVASVTSPLPITLLGLKGKRVEGLNGEKTDEVKLEWSTASEINNKGFEVEMSDNGLAYQTIAFIEGKGNSTTVMSYELRVHNADEAYYRLKQVDFDGTFSYSPIVFVEGVVGKVVVYPNPNNGTFTVVCGTQTTALDSPARLLNAVGKEVWRGVQTEVRTTGLPTGMYFLHTVVAGKTNITKIVIKH